MVRRLKKDILKDLPPKIRQKFILGGINEKKIIKVKRVFDILGEIQNRECKFKVLKQNQDEEVRNNMMDL